MSSKTISTRFVCSFPLERKVIKNLQIVTECVGILEVDAVGYINNAYSRLDQDRYSVDIDFIRFNGVDVKPLLEVVGYMEEITEAAVRMLAEKEGA